MTAQNSLLCCTKQQCKWDHGEDYLHCGLSFLPTGCASGSVSNGNIYSSFSSSTNTPIPRKGTSEVAASQVRCLQRGSCMGSSAEHPHRGLGLGSSWAAMVNTACLYSKRSYQSNTLPFYVCFWSVIAIELSFHTTSFLLADYRERLFSATKVLL